MRETMFGGIRRRVAIGAVALALLFIPAGADAHHATNLDNHAHHYHLHGDHWDYYEWITHSNWGGNHQMEWFNHAHLYYYIRYWCVSEPCAS